MLQFLFFLFLPYLQNYLKGFANSEMEKKSQTTKNYFQ